jgi:hypothetical protein
MNYECRMKNERDLERAGNRTILHSAFCKGVMKDFFGYGTLDVHYAGI